MNVQDPRERCDRLYQLAASPEWASLMGKSSHDVADLLGHPDRITTLVREGVTWTRIVYVCEHLPTRATTEERVAYEQGWRFSPSLLFRDSIVVSEATFDQEVSGGRRAAMPPPELAFHQGGRFP
jgi:hypothetical protein